MGAPGNQRDPKIGDRRSGQHAGLYLLLQMGKDQPLPVAVEHLLAARRPELQTAPRFARFEQEMHFRIVAQRLEMPNPFHGGGDRFLVDDAPCPERNLPAEPLPDQPLEHLHLHLTHQPDLYFPQLSVPRKPELRVLLLELPQFPEREVRVTALGQLHPVGQHRFEAGRLPHGFTAKPFARAAPVQAGHRADLPCKHLFRQPVPAPRIDAQLVGFSLPDRTFRHPLPAVGQQGLHTQAPARDLEKGQTRAARVAANLVNPRTERLRIVGHPGEPFNPF